MAAPEFVPVPPTDRPRSYASPDHVPDPWTMDRPAQVVRQPVGRRLGYQGPDQGYGLVLAEHFRERLRFQAGERADDAVHGCLAIGLRRASRFGRAPVIHDLTIAYTIWGFLDDDPPAELAALRRTVFDGVGNTVHHYAEARDLADRVPEATLAMSHQQVADAYPARWRELVGA